MKNWFIVALSKYIEVTNNIFWTTYRYSRFMLQQIYMNFYWQINANWLSTPTKLYHHQGSRVQCACPGCDI